MVKLVPLATAFLVLGGFILSLILGGAIIQSQNGVPLVNSISNNSAINSLTANLTNSLTSSGGEGQSGLNTFQNSSIQTSGVIPYISAAGGIWSGLIHEPVAIFNFVTAFIFNGIFGGNTAALIITSMVVFILTISIISAVVYLVSRGEGG